ncbi:MAG: hypothetical protein EPO22_03645 [Dehalococcoidia bacterium]|nr:MAG: hypothetical protein EPO22_03645 [Dehalococcoidia bacterium]
MNVKRWTLIGALAISATIAATGPRPSGPATSDTTVVSPGGGAPIVHLGTDPQLQTPPTLATKFDDLSLRKTDVIAPVLDKLYRVDALSRAAANRPVTAAIENELPDDLRGLASSGQMRLDDAGRVQIWADAAGAPSSAAVELAAAGMQVQTIDAGRGIVQGLIPVSQLAAASAIPGVTAIRLPAYGFVDTGSVTTQGDSILNAAALRSAMGVDGTGVRIGVISDGAEGLSTAQGSGDLGAVDTATCNRSPSSTSPTASGAGAEGTAMSEIIHDVAPGAQIYFGYFGMNVGGTSLNFNNAVNCLAANTDIVVDDISWFNTGPNDGTSSVSANTSAALANVSNRIRGYYTVVANQARNHYHAAWVDSGVFTPASKAGDWWQLQRFQGGGGTTDGGLGLTCGSVKCGDTVQVAAGGSFTVLLQWNDAYGNSTNDYDLLVQDNFTGTVSPQNPQRQGAGFPYPVEGFTLANNHGATTTYNILIGNYKALAAAKTFDYFVICRSCFVFNTGLPSPDDIALHNYNTLAGSVPNQADASGGVVSTAAISAFNSPNYDTIEGYSGRGPTADARIKPDVTGIDCVSVTGAAGFSNPFCGTSAAAPHVGAIAALILDCNPSLLAGSGSGTPAGNRTMLLNAILNSAVGLGAPGTDNTFGHGRVDALAAATAAGCSSATPTSTATSTSTATRTPTPTATSTVTPTATATINPTLDTDGDGCPDVKEPQLVPPTDPNNPWDFYSVPVPALFAAPNPLIVFRDATVSAADAQAIFGYFTKAAKSGSTEYEQDLNANGIKDGLEYDRSVAAPGASGPPNGVISAADAQLAFAQFTFGYKC